jgi:hypothetical protein
MNLTLITHNGIGIKAEYEAGANCLSYNISVLAENPNDPDDNDYYMSIGSATATDIDQLAIFFKALYSSMVDED